MSPVIVTELAVTSVGSPVDMVATPRKVAFTTISLLPFPEMIYKKVVFTPSANATLSILTDTVTV